MVDEAKDNHGFPPRAAHITNDGLGGEDWNIHRDFETPFAVIDRDRIRHNSLQMQRWIDEQKAELWPHAKTTMSPELVRMQLDDGAVGITAANMGQVRLLRSWGVQNILLANQVIQPLAAEWIAQDRRHHPKSVFCSFVDSVEGLGVLQSAAQEAGTEFEVLLEVGMNGGRTGVRSREQVAKILESLRMSSNVRLVGVAAYEGSYASDRSAKSIALVDSYLELVAAWLLELIGDGVLATGKAIFSAGGSMFFDRVVKASAQLPPSARIVVRSGCTLLHDHGLYANATPLPNQSSGNELLPALTVWGTVHSRPEPTRAYADVGRRNASYDQGLPVVLRRLPRGDSTPRPIQGIRVIALNDQHAHLELEPKSPLDIGDRIEFGISHPCTTMDKWRRLPIADATGSVVGAISTEF